MLLLPRISWISRADTCVQLCRYVLATAELPEWFEPERDELNPRARAAELVRVLADETAVPLMRQILLRPDEAPDVRLEVLKALVRVHAELPLAELRTLLNDPRFLAAGSYDGEESAPLVGLLQLCRSADAVTAAIIALDGVSAELRAAVLGHVRSHDTPAGMEDVQGVLLLRCLEPGVTPSLHDWLYERWLRRDRFSLQDTTSGRGPTNASVAFWTRNRPQSQALLLGYAARASGDERDRLLRRVYAAGLEEAWKKRYPEAALDVAKEAGRFGALTRGLPGDEALLPVIEAVIRDWITAKAELLRDWGTPKLELRVAFSCALKLIEDWPDTAIEERIAELLHRQDLDEVADDLTWVLWARNRARAVAVALDVARRSRRVTSAYTILRHVAADPEETDRDLLRWASGARRAPHALYAAMEGLEQLGENGEAWRQRLEELANHRDPYVRLRAMSGLARRGDEERIGELRRLASAAPKVCIRAEALRLLGELDAERHFDLLRIALLLDHEGFGSLYVMDNAPAAEEAALALAGLGTPAALTVMVQGYLTAPHTAWCQLELNLEALREPPCERGARPYFNDIMCWRNERDRHWKS